MIQMRPKPIVPLDPTLPMRCEDTAFAYKRMWAAVIKEAVECLDYGARGEKPLVRRQAREEARIWFISDEFGPGSFTWICHILGIDPERTRAILGSRLY